MRPLALALASLALSCTPEIPEGRAACDDDGDCPAGWSCRAEDRGGRCWRTPGEADAGPVDGGSFDAGPADAPPDPPADAPPDAPPQPCMSSAECDDGVACTEDTCVMGRCTFRPPDADMDGYRAICTTPSGPIGDDCDDGAMSVHPGAPEVCNLGRDDDCDALADAEDPDLACAFRQCRPMAAACDEPREITAGFGHTCLVTQASRVFCWGSNEYAQLAEPAVTRRRLVPTLVSSADLPGPISRIDAGAAHTCVIAMDGVRCWGADDQAQLGNPGSGSPSARPLLIAGSGMAQFLGVGAYHGCWGAPGLAFSCWGLNDSGQLGLGDTTTRETPQVVATTAGTFPAGGGGHTCYAPGPTGTVRCMGHNAFGQLGDGTNVDRTMAVPSMLTDAAPLTLALGAHHTCAWRESGAPGYYCWGRNDSGQVGDGTTTGRQVPVPVSGLGALGAPMHRTAAGASHTCATDAMLRLWCWGENERGQIGVGDGMDRAAPARVAVLSDEVVDVAAGVAHTCAIVTGALGTRVYCWGANLEGQLGDGSMTDRDVPVLVRPPPP
jgi:alpha-tubulin suppressor-like RCC1 family protein